MQASATNGGKTVQFPKISVISPSYNQARYLETTLKSVLDQQYPALEYIVMDGGSTDGSPEIIRRYSEKLAYWVSEPDKGQSDAINKGFARSTGEVLCWLNSDDFLEPGTLQFVGEFFAENPDVDVLCGSVNAVDASLTVLGTNPARFEGRASLAAYWGSSSLHQASVFWRRRVYERLGGVREDLHLVMDYDYWLRMSKWFNFRCVDRVLANATMHPEQKTADFSRYQQAQRKLIFEKFASPLSLRDWNIRAMLYLHLSKTLVMAVPRRCRSLVKKAIRGA